jgi:hypothetical protein
MQAVGGGTSPIETWSSESPPARPRLVSARLLMLLSTVVVSLAIQRVCRSSSGFDSTSRAADHGPVRLELQLPDSVSSGKVVPIWLIVTNRSADSIRLKLDANGKSLAAPEFDVEVNDALGSEVWRRIRPDIDKGFRPIRVGKAEARVIPPHGRVAWSAGWNQRNNHGTLVAPGEYFLVGIIPAVVPGLTATDSLRSPRRRLIIRR